MLKDSDKSLRKIFLGLGTNIGDRENNLEKARAMLSEKVKVVQESRIYESEPYGEKDQDWFLNQCIEIESELGPRELLEFCQSIENEMGRVREKHWGPRIIDIDILLYGDLKIDEPGLSIPHKELEKRLFVLKPLAEIAPEIASPLLSSCSDTSIVRI